MSVWDDNDIAFMRRALAAARSAGAGSEVPVGAVVVQHRKVIAEAGNRTIADKDPSGHAEILALRAAASAQNNHRLTDATLYVTLEPCTMCVGAIVQARIQRVVFGAYDQRAGALGSALDLSTSVAFNHAFEVNGGLLDDECRYLMQEFFESRRSEGAD